MTVFINTVTSTAKPARSSVTLGVEADLAGITVPAGKFKINGSSYEFTAPHAWVFPGDYGQDTWVAAYLAWREVPGEVVLVIDEVSLAEVGFDFRGSGFKSLKRLWSIHIPSGSTDLNTLTVNVYHLIKPPE